MTFFLSRNSKIIFPSTFSGNKILIGSFTWSGPDMTIFGHIDDDLGVCGSRPSFRFHDRVLILRYLGAKMPRRIMEDFSLRIGTVKLIIVIARKCYRTFNLRLYNITSWIFWNKIHVKFTTPVKAVQFFWAPFVKKIVRSLHSNSKLNLEFFQHQANMMTLQIQIKRNTPLCVKNTVGYNFRWRFYTNIYLEVCIRFPSFIETWIFNYPEPKILGIPAIQLSHDTSYFLRNFSSKSQ